MKSDHPAGHSHVHGTDANGSGEPSTPPERATEPPAEPGYPKHPEIPHAPGAMHEAGSDAHAHHGDHKAAASTTRPEPRGGHEAPVATDAHQDHGTHEDHDKHAGHNPDMFRDLFWISLLLTIPTVYFSHMVQEILGYTAPVFPGSRWIEPVFGTAVFVYGGRVFLKGAVSELRSRLPGMMTLISLAITVAFVFSAAVTLGYEGVPLWWELATLVTIMLLGHWMEMRSIQQASGALKELAKLLPSMATRVRDGVEEQVPLDQLRDGDTVLVRPGESIGADGVVRQGESDVNEAMITGESRPLKKKPDDQVIAGTVNGTGSLRIEVTGTGERTALAGIMRLVAQAQTSRSRAQALADRAAFWLTLVAIGSAVATFIVWVVLGAEMPWIIERVVTVLVVACPHALGLAIPLVVAISTTIGARSGLLVRDRRGLEEARNIDTVVFDKTGTLTLGEFRVVDVATSDVGDDEVLALAAAVEGDSEHSIARGIVSSARDRGLTIPGATGFAAIPGHGVRASVEGREVQIGGPALLRQLGLELPAELRAASERAAERGQASIAIIRDGQPIAVLAIADAIRPEAREAIDRLHAENIQVVMMTGDARAVANAVAADLGIDTVFAEVLPEQKSSKIEELQRGGRRVAMVGDGVNDAPALVTSDVGIAIGAGTDVAVEAGDVVLVRSDPRDVPRIIALSKATYRKMVQNLWWAAGYNIVAIPLAAGALAGVGIVLHPAVGAVLMSASTVIVALNAQLLRRARL